MNNCLFLSREETKPILKKLGKNLKFLIKKINLGKNSIYLRKILIVSRLSIITYGKICAERSAISQMINSHKYWIKKIDIIAKSDYFKVKIPSGLCAITYLGVC